MWPLHTYGRLAAAGSHVCAVLYTLLAAANELSGTACTNEVCVYNNSPAFWLEKWLNSGQVVNIAASGRVVGENGRLFCCQVGVPIRLCHHVKAMNREGDAYLHHTCVTALVEPPATASYGGGGSKGQKTSTPLIRAP